MWPLFWNVRHKFEVQLQRDINIELKGSNKFLPRSRYAGDYPIIEPFQTTEEG